MCVSENSFPIISQIKSFIFLLHCDTYGATQIQIAFCKQCIFVSQLRSLYELISYYPDTHIAFETQKEFYHASILTFPGISQLISLFYLCLCQFGKSFRIQQIFFTNLSNLLLFPLRFISYLLHPWGYVGSRYSYYSDNCIYINQDSNQDNHTNNSNSNNTTSKRNTKRKINLSSWMYDEFKDVPLTWYT